MPCDCGLLCLLTDRRRYCELLWRRRLLVTNDEKKAKRRFLNLMRGFDSEDLDVLRKAVESNGRDIKQCAPGPPMDLVEEPEEEEVEFMIDPMTAGPSSGGGGSRGALGCSTTIVSTRPRHSINRLERDRVLFQRQKFPEAGTTTSPHSNAIAGAVLTTARQQPRKYSSGRPRRTSSINRRYNYATDENANTAADLNESTSSQGGDDYYYDQPTSRQLRQKQGQPSSSRTAQLLLEDQEEPTPPLYDDSGLIPQIDRPMSMPYLCCKMWRWKDLQVDAALHRLDPLPWCRFGRVTINNATVSCCNPYHYGLWIRPEHSSGSEEQSVSGMPFASTGGLLANGGGHILCAEHTVTNDTGYSADETGGIGHVRHSIFRTADLLLTGGENNNDVLPDLPPPPVPTTYDLNIASPSVYTTPNHLPPSIHTQAIAWGRMARWERKERIGEVVALVGQFVAIGKLAGTVFDGQDVKSHWDVENQVSFALIRQAEGDNSEDIWLYNSGDKPLFLCISRTLSSARSDTIRRLSPGYCIRVHRTPSNTATEHTSAATAAAAELIHTAALAGRHSIQLADPLLMNTVSFLTISVGTGWGINYQRLYVTEVPCRYEIIFT